MLEIWSWLPVVIPSNVFLGTTWSRGWGHNWPMLSFRMFSTLFSDFLRNISMESAKRKLMTFLPWSLLKHFLPYVIRNPPKTFKILWTTQKYQPVLRNHTWIKATLFLSARSMASSCVSSSFALIFDNFILSKSSTSEYTEDSSWSCDFGGDSNMIPQSGGASILRTYSAWHMWLASGWTKKSLNGTESRKYQSKINHKRNCWQKQIHHSLAGPVIHSWQMRKIFLDSNNFF